MDERQLRLLRLLLQADALKFGDFILKSGRRSPYFVNLGALYRGDQLAAVGEAYAETIAEKIGLDFDVVFGPAYKGIPLAVATAQAIWRLYNRQVGYCSDRKEEKNHGEGGRLLGAPIGPETRVVYVDDVISAGTSFRHSLRLLRDRLGAKIIGSVIAVDRQERGTKHLVSSVRELQAEFGVPIYAILRMREVVESLAEKPFEGKVYVDKELREDFLAYQRRYGVE